MLKSIGKNLGFAALFTNIIRRDAMPEEAFIHTAKMTVIKITLKEIQKRWVLYTDSQSFMQSIEYKKENRPILNHI